MKRILILITVMCSATGWLRAQQEPQYTLYMLNPFIINPAEAGIADYYQIRTNHRFQWAGMKDAPVTNSISVYGPHQTKMMGFGGNIYNDIVGPTSRTGFTGTYAYNMELNRDIRVSGGISAGLIQYKLDGTKITVTDNSDPTFHQAVYSGFSPDMSVGVFAWSPATWYAGFSVKQLVNWSMDLNDNGAKVNRLKPHMYLVGGYKFDVSPRKNRLWVVEPCMILKKVIPANYSLEMDCRVTYNMKLWSGLAFRTGDAISFLMGYNYKTSFYIAYAFDYAMSDIRLYTIGSHEFVVGYNFDRIRNKKFKRPSANKKK